MVDMNGNYSNVTVKRWVFRRVLKQSREGAEVMFHGRLLYEDGPKIEKALLPYVFVVWLGMTREGLAEERSVLADLRGTRRDAI